MVHAQLDQEEINEDREDIKVRQNDVRDDEIDVRKVVKGGTDNSNALL